MDEIIIYHNPRCSKSRQTLDLLEGHNPTIIEYLKNPPSRKELVEILNKLGMDATELSREKCKSNKDCLDLMVADPSVIQRPIIIKGNKAVLGRPPENVLSLLK